MTGLIITLLGAFGPKLLQTIEGLFGRGNGAAKMEMAAQIASLLLSIFVKNGKLAKPAIEDIIAALEALLSASKVSGIIPDYSNTITPLIPTVTDGTFTFQVPTGTVPMRVNGGVFFIPQTTVNKTT